MPLLEVALNPLGLKWNEIQTRPRATNTLQSLVFIKFVGEPHFTGPVEVSICLAGTGHS